MQTRSEISVPLTGKAPPRLREFGTGGLVFIWCTVVATVAGGAILFWFDPAANGFYPRCFFRMITGWDCPGCGGLRATHQLLHGHLREAFALNPLFVIATPVIFLFLARSLFSRIAGKKIPLPFDNTIWVWIAAVIVIGFGILRNLPWGAWLASSL